MFKKIKKVWNINKSRFVTVFGRKEKQIEPFYHLVAQQPDGKKIAFGVDQGGK